MSEISHIKTELSLTNQILQLLFWWETEVITEVTVLFITAENINILLTSSWFSESISPAGGAGGIVPNSPAVVDASFGVRFGLEAAVQRLGLDRLLLDCSLRGVLVTLGLGENLRGGGRTLLPIFHSGCRTVGHFLRRFLHGGQLRLLVSEPFSLPFSFRLHLGPVSVTSRFF